MRGVALIVLAWNQWPLTRQSLDSLLATDLDEAEVIVVDNGSSDETPRALVAYADRVRILTMPENLGFVRGMNAGIAAARPDDDVVLLNNDLVFTQRDWLGRLRDAAYAAPDIGIVGCRLLGPEPEGRVYHTGAFIEPDRLWGQQTESGLAERDVAQYTRFRRVEGIAFALAYIRRDCLDRIGALDAAFHSYFEDTDYCLRAADVGIASALAGAVTLRHEQHGSTSEDTSFRTGIFERSRATFAARWQQRLAERYRGNVLWQGVTRMPTVYARLARDYVRRIDARGLRTSFEPLRSELADAQDFRLELASQRQWPASPDAAIVCAPASSFARAHGRVRAGLGFCDFDRVPTEWAGAANTLDRLIVPDAFQAEAFRAGGARVPIEIVPLGVDRDYFHPRVPSPRHPQGHFVFAAVAEDLVRDASDVLITAFRRAFDADAPVELLLRLCPAHDADMTKSLTRLVEETDGARVRLLQGWAFPDQERAQWLGAADAYVSVRRSGAWDPLAAEAIAMGRTLIAGDFGSQAELARVHGHVVARSRLVAANDHLHCRWAEPDVESLVDALRAAYESRDVDRRASAIRFAADHDIDTSADRLVGVLEECGAFRPRPASPTPHRPAVLARPAGGEIVVLGMHRSGTSSVAGLLARFGAWPGENSALLIGPDNPRGHYELAELHSACVRRLAAAGGDWKQPPVDALPEAIDAFRREVAAILDTLAPRRPWFVKEPRLCLLVRELLPLLTRPVFVHVVRDPLEVADSLAARDGLDRNDALALWERYTRSAFAATRGWPRIVVDYGELIADSYATATRLHADLVALGVQGLVAPDPVAIASWIEPELRRHAVAERDRAMLTASQRALLGAIEDGSVLDLDFAEEGVVAEAATWRAAG
ncbi:MAG TPA: glycosyltransferase [Rhodanobacteraceae bacterium]|nr:glycosyltransferase [Rhodanobacteraceae bacterium]